jgi:hypothetical protein
MSTSAPALNPVEAVLGINNGPGLYIAPAGATGANLPASLTTAWAAPWEALGYVSEDGVTLAADVTSDAITPWQSTSPIRQVITGKAYTMAFTLWQTNPRSLGLYFDANLPDVDGDSFKFDVRSDEGGFIHAIGLDVRDGNRITRLVFPRAQLSDNDDVTVARGEVIGWGVTLSALDDSGVLATIQSGTVTGDGGSGGGETESRSLKSRSTSN